MAYNGIGTKIAKARDDKLFRKEWLEKVSAKNPERLKSLQRVFRSAGDSASALRGAEQFDLIRQRWVRVVELLDADPTLTMDEAEEVADPEYQEQRAEIRELDEARLAAHNKAQAGGRLWWSLMAKKTNRGSEISVTIPTEPMAGRAKNVPVMLVQVQDDGEEIFTYPIPEGQAITFHVGGNIVAYMKRTEAPVPDVEMFAIAGSRNKEAVTIEYEHALSGLQKVQLQPGQKLTVNAVAARNWVMSAPNWEDPGKKDGAKAGKPKVGGSHRH